MVLITNFWCGRGACKRYTNGNDTRADDKNELNLMLRTLNETNVEVNRSNFTFEDIKNSLPYFEFNSYYITNQSSDSVEAELSKESSNSDSVNILYSNNLIDKEINKYTFETTCSICLSDYKHEEILCCHHTFHKHCMLTWLLTRLTCPLCKGHIQICNGQQRSETGNIPRNEVLPSLVNSKYLIDLYILCY